MTFSFDIFLFGFFLFPVFAVLFVLEPAFQLYQNISNFLFHNSQNYFLKTTGLNQKEFWNAACKLAGQTSKDVLKKNTEETNNGIIKRRISGGRRVEIGRRNYQHDSGFHSSLLAPRIFYEINQR